MTNTSIEESTQKNYQSEGDAAFKDGDLAVAASLYQQAIDIDTNNAWAEYSLAEVYRCQGNFSEAIHHYIQSLKLDPFSSSPFIQLLFTKAAPEQLDPIITFYQQLSIAKPRNPWISVRLGDLFTKQSNLPAAIASYKAASRKLLQQNYPHYVSQHWDNSTSSEPAYIIIGPMKTATSALYEYINHHPNVLPSIKKEIHFFNDRTKLGYGKDWYSSHFPPIPSGSNYVTGEASPGYIVNNVHDTTFSLFPSTKIIALVRDPVARTISHYMHDCKHGFERRSFTDAISSEMELLEQLNEGISIYQITKRWNWSRNRGYILQSLYVYFLEQWYATFPHEQILIVNNQALLDHPENAMQQIFSFLQLDAHRSSSYPKHNAGSYASDTISTDIKRKLQTFFRPHEEKLKAFLEKENCLFVT